nr:hypothetical protein [Tanacetum cinerariifolium]
RRRSKQRIENLNLDDLSPPVVTMADQRTMAQLLQAPTEGYEDAIVFPEITADNFELKHGLLTLGQNKQFFRHDKEDSHAHVRYFNKITFTLKFLNVPNTSIKLVVFPFSLEGAARIWLEIEPPRSIFTWDDLVSKFINQFFPPSKTTNLRNEITNFQQRFDESFNQDSLNSAAGGNFLDKMPRESLAFIESKSKVCYSRNKPVVAKVSTNDSTSGVSPDVAELKDMVKALLLDKKGQNQSPALVKAAEESCVTCGGAHSYRNSPSIDGNIYHDNIQEFVSQASIVNYNQGNTRYRPPMMSNQIRPPGFPPEDFSAYVKANDAVMKNMQTQGQNMQNQLTNLTDLITKFVNSNSASTSSSGTLPSNMIANPKSDLKAITTRSGVSYDGPQIPPPPSSLPKVVENEPEVTKDTVNPTNNGNTKDVQPQAVQSESRVLISKHVTSLIFEPAIAPVSTSKPNPKASIPYPSRRNDKRNLVNDNSIPFGVEDSPFNMDEDILFLERLLIEEPFLNPPIIPNQTKSPIEEPKHSFNMGYEHFNTNLVTNDVAESSTKNLVPIPREFKVTSKNGSESIEPVNDNSSVFTTISNPLFDNDKINSDEINSHVESNSNESTSNHDTEKFDNLDEFSGPLILIHIVEEERIRMEHADYINRIEMLFTINPRRHPSTYANTNVESFSSLPIPIQESDPHQEDIDVVSVTNDVLPPSVENDDSDVEEVDAVDDLRVDNSIQNSEHEYSKSEDSDFDNLSVPLSPPEPPDEEFDFKKDFGNEISVVRNTIVKFECIDARVKSDVFNDKNDDLSYFMFAKVFSLLSAESEDTIFDPGISD